MKAVDYDQPGLPVDSAKSLYEIDLPKPQPGPRDLLVKIQAIAVNPVDSKLRQAMPTAAPRILRWDAAGTVETVGADVTLFKVGDKFGM